MVFFVCEGCNESLKKNKVDAHASRCRNCWAVTCVDCSKTFEGDDYRQHTACISEAEKYEGSCYQGNNKTLQALKKGMTMQEKWNAAVQSATCPSPSSQAGADAPNLSGTWLLDRDLSESTNNYLEAMGLPLIARQAADKLGLLVVIDQTPGDFTITRKTRIFTETKSLKFGQETLVKSNTVGATALLLLTLQIRVTATPEQITTITHMPSCQGYLTDTRTLLDGNQKMKVVLELELPGKGPVIVTRVFNKLSESTRMDIDDETFAKYEAMMTVQPEYQPKRKR